MVRDTDLGSPSWSSRSGSLESDKATSWPAAVSTTKAKQRTGEEDHRRDGSSAHQAEELRVRPQGCQRESRSSQAEGEVRAPPGQGDSR